MSKKLEIKQIAEELALSSTTVSRALSGKGRVSDATRQRVQEYIKANNAAPAVRRRPYTARKTRNILVTVAGERNYGLLPYFSQVIMGAYDFFQPLGYQALVAKTSEDDIEPLKKVIKQHKCDGVILSRTLDNALDIRFLQEKGVPFVTIGSYDDNTLYQIDVDQRGGCKELTMRLLQQGVRNIALFCANRTHVVTQSRWRGFLQAYEVLGLDFDKSFLFEETGYADVAERCTEQMLKAGAECIVCMDDNICLNVLNALRKFEVRIPEDILVASFYNSSVLEEYYPPISCVNLDIQALARTASGVLYDLLQGKEAKKRILQGYEVLIKDSTNRDKMRK